MEHKGAAVQLTSHCDKHTEMNKSDDLRKRKTSIDMQIDEERYFFGSKFNPSAPILVQNQLINKFIRWF